LGIPPDIEDYACYAWWVVDDSWTTAAYGVDFALGKLREDLFGCWGWRPYNVAPYNVRFPERGITGRTRNGDQSRWVGETPDDKFFPSKGALITSSISVLREYTLESILVINDTSLDRRDTRTIEQSIEFSADGVPTHADVQNPYIYPADVGLLLYPDGDTTSEIRSDERTADETPPRFSAYYPNAALCVCEFNFTREVTTATTREESFSRYTGHIDWPGVIDGGYRTILRTDGWWNEMRLYDGHYHYEHTTVSRTSFFESRSAIVRDEEEFDGPFSIIGSNYIGYDETRERHIDGMGLGVLAGQNIGLVISGLAPQTMGTLFDTGEPHGPDFDIAEAVEHPVQGPNYRLPSAVRYNIHSAMRVMPIFDFGTAFQLLENSVFVTSGDGGESSGIDEDGV